MDFTFTPDQLCIHGGVLAPGARSNSLILNENGFFVARDQTWWEFTCEEGASISLTNPAGSDVGVLLDGNSPQTVSTTFGTPALLASGLAAGRHVLGLMGYALVRKTGSDWPVTLTVTGSAPTCTPLSPFSVSADSLQYPISNLNGVHTHYGALGDGQMATLLEQSPSGYEGQIRFYGQIDSIRLLARGSGGTPDWGVLAGAKFALLKDGMVFSVDGSDSFQIGTFGADPKYDAQASGYVYNLADGIDDGSPHEWAIAYVDSSNTTMGVDEFACVCVLVDDVQAHSWTYPERHIAGAGDSNTNGEYIGTSRKDVWLIQLAGLMGGAEHSAYGFTGETVGSYAVSMIGRWPETLTHFVRPPQYVFLNGGTNDARYFLLGGTPTHESTQANWISAIESRLDDATIADATIVVMSPIPAASTLPGLNAEIVTNQVPIIQTAIAQVQADRPEASARLRFVNLTNIPGITDDDYSDDVGPGSSSGLHFGPSGHTKWAQYLFDTLFPTLPPTSAPTVSLDSELKLVFSGGAGGTSYAVENDGEVDDNDPVSPYDLHWGEDPEFPHRARVRAINSAGSGPWSRLVRLGGSSGGGMTVLPSPAMLTLP